MKHPRSPYDQVGGIVYLGRMLDKIRLQAADELPADCVENLGKGFDKRCASFLRVSYDDLAAEVRSGLSDEEVLDWCYVHGQQPDEEQIEIWNEFMRKRGWNDAGTETLIMRKKQSGLEHRDDIVTMFGYIDADEGRPVS